MFKWWKKRIYRNDVSANVMAMTLMIGDDAGLIQTYSGIKDAINLSFEDGTQSEVASTYIAASLIGHAIDRSDGIDRKKAVEQELFDWSLREVQEQRSIIKLMRDGELDQDMLLTRCQWLLMMAQDFLLDGKIEEDHFRFLKDSIYGALNGETFERRRDVFIDEALNDALGLAKLPPKEQAAYQLGQDAAKSMANDLDEFIEIRFGHLEDAYLKVLEGNFLAAKTSIDHSPLIIARVDFDFFRENVEEAKAKMLVEINSNMSEWSSTMDSIESGSSLDDLIMSRVEDISTGLTLAGLNLFTKHAEEIKAADDAWRQNFPEQAAKEPLED